MLPVRTKVIVAIACTIGAATGALTYLASRSVPQSLLAAGAATGTSAGLLRQLTGTIPERTASGRDSDQSNGHDDVEQKTT
jgi:hypothetical protein